MDDALNSFIKRLEEGERSLSSLIGEANAVSLTSAALRERFSEMLELIAREPTDIRGWIEMGAIVGNSGPYAEFRDEFERRMLSIDFLRFFEENQRIAQLALNTILLLSAHIDEFRDLRSYVGDSLLRIAERCAAMYPKLRGDDSEAAGELAAWLLQSFMNLWIAGASSGLDDSISALLSRVMFIWPAAARPYRRVLQRVFETESLRTSSLLANAILFARASRRGEAD
jgi:hypothetical protein